MTMPNVERPQPETGPNRVEVVSPRRKKDHRATVQAQKLRVSLATEAISHGEVVPSSGKRTYKVLLGSAALAAIILVITIGAATVIQML